LVTSATRKILEDALALSEEQRATLVAALNESLETTEDDLTPEWKAEIARRIEAVERGDSRLIPGDEVEARIRKTLREIS
jgi:putative addiction module component (TIGR02574 family)